MSTLISLTCLKCRAEHAKDVRFFRCPACDGFLDPTYDYGAIKATFSWDAVGQRPRSIWRWRELLPIEREDCEVSLGEGDTPLVRARSLADRLGLDRMYIKNDGLNPTGSLKDRSIAVAASKALEFGYRVIASDSSGNKAASMSGYAARAGLVSLVFCPVTTPTQKLLQILAYGGRLVVVDTDRSGLMALYNELIRRKEQEWYDLGISNPFRYEGKKTYAYEIAEAFGGRAPDWILQPAGGSMSVIKNWKGFRELRTLGAVQGMPKLVAVQPERCAPIVRAYEQGKDVVSPVKLVPTIAGGLSIANPGEAGTLTLRAVRESGGAAVAVTEEEILWGMRELGSEGIFSEPTGAVTIPALRRLVEASTIRRGDTVVCVVTGSGFKDLHTLEEQVRLPRPVSAKVAAVEEYAQNLLA